MNGLKAGFLGGWIVVHLLMRGEDPKKIRVLDIRPPTREDLTTGRAKAIDFRIVDIANADAVNEAFRAPWADSDNSEITVFHTAANIRFYERASSLISLSAKVNVDGTRNILKASQNAGVTTLVYTSSGSISVRRTRFWLWPWEKEPEYFVQAINDDDSLIPNRHGDFFSNYAYTKSMGEAMVRSADRTPSGMGKVLRTGCLRPGNGVYGPGGDILCGAYLVRRFNPTWISHVMENFIYVENCSLAHLFYEQRFIELAQGSKNPDVGGQAFCITDNGPPPTYGDVYLSLNVLTHGRTVFPELSPSLMLLVAHIFEIIYLTRIKILQLPFPLRLLNRLVPQLNGDLINLQPSMFALVMPHLIFDDSRARLSPSKGGLGYKGKWTTLEGLCKLVDEFEKTGDKIEERQKTSGGISFGFGWSRAERGVGKVAKSLYALETAPETVLN